MQRQRAQMLVEVNNQIKEARDQIHRGSVGLGKL
jgi:hypothetical protein